LNSFHTNSLKKPYLIFLGDVADPILTKTGAGIVEWRKQDVVGQLRLNGCQANLGVQDLSIEESLVKGAGSLLIGVAPAGGSVPKKWIPVLKQALDCGMDIVSGLHTELNDINELSIASKKSGANIINVRKASAETPVATGVKRSGMRLLTVGTDCAVGKKYTALSLERCMKAHGIPATFRATGQTGIMIAGGGVAIDSIVSDFIAGVAELISPDNHEEHWDIIEGQGSLFNPSYSGVSLGLLHGSQPDAIVLCHDPSREAISTAKDLAIPTIKDCIELNLQCARIVNPNAICIGVAINTSSLSKEQAKAYLQELSTELDLPCIDPLAHGADLIVEEIKNKFPRRTLNQNISS
jgi:uncharacterized NAD-dependent epimerase/dehydratase family protein